MKDIVLAFSGGTDSYTAVKILTSQGFRVRALTIDMMGDRDIVLRARRSSEQLGVSFDVVDMRQQFSDSVEANFVSEYLSGRTPAPCTLCNRVIKWRVLREYADAQGIEHIATGHYFRIVEHGGHHYVARARDKRKEQSYYLWGLDETLLRRVVTPMADIIKEDIKAASPIKGESMGVCFLRGVGYSEYIEQRCGMQACGDVVDREGRVVGRHRGIAHYTIGQRRGEGLPQGLSVAQIDARNNRIVVGSRESLYTKEITITECNIIDPAELRCDDITVVVRGIGLNPEGYAKVTPCANGLHLSLSQRAWAVAPGQPIVLYRGDRVIGGGITTR